MVKKASEETIRRVLELHSGGMSFARIGQEVGLSGEGCRKIVLRHSGDKAHPMPEFTQKGGPPKVKEKLDRVEDTTDLDGEVSILKVDRILSPKELKEAAGLGDEWIATHYRPNFWDGFYKLKVPDKDGDLHRKVRLFQSKAAFKRVIGEELRDGILQWVAENVPRQPPPKLTTRETPVDQRTPYVVSWGIWDAHLGMYAYAPEVGTHYDVDIARRRVFNSIDDMVEELSLYNVKTIWMPVGNDFFHFDNVRHRTAEGDHYLDVDSRSTRVYRAGVQCMVYMVRRATEICDDVQIFWIPGNHDTLTSYTLLATLQGWFWNDPRVKFDLSENPTKIKRHGGVAIMYDHGKNIPANQFVQIFHQRVGAAKLSYKEIQIGHKHQKRTKVYESETPTNSIKIVTNPALCNVDHYHHIRGLDGEPMKSVEAYRYDETGVRGSHITYARDDQNDQVTKVRNEVCKT